MKPILPIWYTCTVIFFVLLSGLLVRTDTGVTFASDVSVDAVETGKHFLYLEPGTTQSDLYQLLVSLNVELIDWLPQIDLAIVRFSPSVHSGSQLGIDRLSGKLEAEHLFVKGLEMDGQVHGAYIPNDPDIVDPQRVYSAELLNTFEAWDYTTGSQDVTVAVLDTGIALGHYEFQDRLVPGYDFYNDDADPSDDHGHGTHVSGIVAAAIDNGQGSAGVCPNCTIMPIKVLNEKNAGTWAIVVEAILYATDQGADIIVLSLGSTEGTTAVKDAIAYAIEKDVLVVAAAGNANSSNPFYPAAYDGVLGVSATDRDDKPWGLSNYGDYIDVAAPGQFIYSTYYALDNEYDGHIFMSGTSMATPHVAGLAGLLLSQDSTRTNIQLTNLITSTATDIEKTGWDSHTGFGRINLEAALATGAPTPLYGELSGTIWWDKDVDDVIDSDEPGRFNNIQIQLVDSEQDVIRTVYSDQQGVWQVDNLSAGEYSIHVTAINGFVIVGDNEANVLLGAGQSLSNIDFGFAQLPTSDAIQNVRTHRTDNVVVIQWDVIDPVLSTVVLERAVGSQKAFDKVGEIRVEVTGASGQSSEQFEDRLPDDTNDTTIYYRMQLKPGDAYIDNIKVMPETGTTTLPEIDYSIFVPIIINE